MLEKSFPLFVENCIEDIVVNVEVCRTHAESSGSVSTVISVLYGYKEGSRVAEYAYKNNITVKEAAVQQEILTADEAERLLDPLNLTNPELSREILFGEGVK